MSFWRTFGFTAVSAIDTILESEEFTLEQLLDEEDILQETKAQNPKLIEYLSKPESLRKLLTYITNEPDIDADQKRRFKYPFLACEILASEVWQLMEGFYKETDLLEQLYSFLEKPAPLNPMLASYSSRVAGVFLQKKVPETIEFLQQKKDIVRCFINHLGNASVMDLLLKVIASDNSVGEINTLEWLCKTDLIPSLIHKFDPKLDEQENENASQALVDIINISSINPNSPLIAQIESEQVIIQLYEFMLAGGLSASLLRGLDVLIELLKRHIQMLDTTSQIEDLNPFLQITLKHANHLYNYLETPHSDTNPRKVLLSGIGEFIPLGFHRLKIVEFFVALIRTNYNCISLYLTKLGAISRCLNLFFEYPWNNFLHTLVYQMVEEILNGANLELKLSLIKEAKLLDLISLASKQNDISVSKPKGYRTGNMGHITLLATLLIQKSNEEEQISQLLAVNKEWQSFTAEGGVLSETRKKQTDSMPDDEVHNPTYSFEEEEEETEKEKDDFSIPMEAQSSIEVWEEKSTEEIKPFSPTKEEEEEETEKEKDDFSIPMEAQSSIEVWEEKSTEEIKPSSPTNTEQAATH